MNILTFSLGDQTITPALFPLMFHRSLKIKCDSFLVGTWHFHKKQTGDQLDPK